MVAWGITNRVINLPSDHVIAEFDINRVSGVIAKLM
jgi:hypothetical protein